MRVLYFTDNNSDHNRRFLEKLATSGHEIFYLSLAGRPNPSYWLPRGIRLVECDTTFPRHSLPLMMKPFVSELKRVIAEVKPDLIHAGAIQSCAYLAALSEFHPMLAMSWGSDLLVDSDRDHEWKKATSIALQGADGFFCDCQTVLRKARQFSSFPDDSVVMFPWGIQKGVFRPDGQKMPGVAESGNFVFICTRSWEPIYGIDTLLKAFTLMLKEDENVRLLLIGHGSKEADVRDYIERNDLLEHVIVPGTVLGGEMPRYFRSASTYVSCAESDGTSISLLEGMATGLPMVVADNASNREWVIEGKNGFLAEIGSAESFAEKMLRSIRLPAEQRAAMAELNRDTVAERADWDRNFPQLLRAYDKLVGRSISAKQ
jgi:L-malate glycosyltransferase